MLEVLVVIELDKRRVYRRTNEEKNKVNTFVQDAGAKTVLIRKVISKIKCNAKISFKERLCSDSNVISSKPTKLLN